MNYWWLFLFKKGSGEKKPAEAGFLMTRIIN